MVSRFFSFSLGRIPQLEDSSDESEGLVAEEPKGWAKANKRPRMGVDEEEEEEGNDSNDDDEEEEEEGDEGEDDESDLESMAQQLENFMD